MKARFPSYAVVPKQQDFVVTYSQNTAFACATGFSLNGKPNGDTAFEETCKANGRFSKKKKCKDIDYCLIERCGKKGKCKDGRFTYTCDCDKGYAVVADEEGYDTCKQIDECDTMEGNELCANKGVCKDKLLKYECKCDEGYKNKETENGRDSCEPKMCGSPTEIENARTIKAEMKIWYPQTVPYVCNTGYSTSGKVDGDISFETSCTADASFSEGKECKPVECGAPIEVDNAKCDAKELKYPEKATYKCDEGYTISGEADSSAKFTVSCTAAGTISDTSECLPVNCGVPPSVQFALFDTNAVVYKQKAKYECIKGHTTTGEADGKTSFMIECGANGKFEDPDHCMPIRCGEPKSVKHGLVPMGVYTFDQNYQVICNAGYTMSGDPDGESTFIVTCGSEGKFKVKEKEKCDPVKCPKPKDLPGATSKDDAKVYKEEAKWQCKEGFSLNGRDGGPTKLKKRCMADGTYGDSTPSDCIDINFCFGNPCGKNGDCTDLGPGKVDPGYKCTCFEGFEVKKDGGKETCSADDCQGDPCGAGGTCIDLSKLDPPGPEGQYSCECEEGYSLVSKKGSPPKFTCERNVCGPVQEVKKLAEDGVELILWEPPAKRDEDKLTGQPILLSFDSVKYTCKEGYSTDGTFTPESISFTINCEAGGVWSRTVQSDKECRPVKCDSFQLPAVPFTHVRDELENFYEFPESVGFKCWNGYTLNGEAGGPKLFDIKCAADGEFEEVEKHCRKITCGRPPSHKKSTRATERSIFFGESATYHCDDGYTIDGSGSSTGVYVGVCKDDGTIVFSAGPEGGTAITVTDGGVCTLVSCGSPPAALSATYRSLNGPMTAISEPAVAECASGHTVGGLSGGSEFYFVRCQANGQFTGTANRCEPVKYSVSGIITDVTSGAIKIPGAKVVCEKDGVVVDTAYTNSIGMYTVQLAKGSYKATAAKTGYLPAEENIRVRQAPIQIGQGADMSMSEELPVGTWRAVVDWARKTPDVDSHSYFGDKLSKHACWYDRGPMTAPGTDVTVTLDR